MTVSELLPAIVEFAANGFDEQIVGVIGDDGQQGRGGEDVVHGGELAEKILGHVVSFCRLGRVGGVFGTHQKDRR